MIYRVAAIGAAVAATVGIMSGGMMRPDASQFERPGQQLISEIPIDEISQPVGWTRPGPVPSYVAGTDATKGFGADNSFDLAQRDADLYRGDTDLYRRYPELMQPAAWHPKADTRPSQDDRADAIVSAQATSPAITSPPPNPQARASFPTIDGNTLSGVTGLVDHAAAVAAAPTNAVAPQDAAGTGPATRDTPALVGGPGHPS